MSRNEVDIMLAAVHHADALHHEAPYSGLSPDKQDRRYAEWMIEYLQDNGWALARWVA